jgi:S1-C subfamily serine protease
MDAFLAVGQNRRAAILWQYCVGLTTSGTRGIILAANFHGRYRATAGLAPWLLSALAVPAYAADSGLPAVATAGSRSIDNSVVKVFATMRYPDPFRPWTKQSPADVTASGVVIEGRRILTNAHAVLYASQVQVQANQAGDKLSATVVAVAPGIDLAVLKLDDESFFDAHAPLPRASTLPDIKDAVLAYGYPTGGNSLSITKGIVSRIEFMPYGFHVSGLRIQIDAAINPGNSGGPAVVGERMIGLAFSTLGEAQNIGYIIPNEEIELFLRDIADGRYDGKPQMFDELQTLENPALRAFLKLDSGVSGVIVHRPFRSDAAYPLRQWDVITRIADTPIDDQGMIRLGATLRVNFQYLVQHAAVNGSVPLSIVRGGRSQQIQLPVAAGYPALIPSLAGDYPPYFIYGPLVFSRATLEYFSFASNNAAMMRGLGAIGSPLLTRLGDAPDADTQELVVIAAPFFPHKLAKGYGNPSAAVVSAVNGVRVRSLRHLVALLRDLKDDYVNFEIGHRGAETLVFSRQDMVAATNDILNDNGVRAQASPELLAIWQNRAAP